MKAYTKEPQKCENCDGTEKMNFVQDVEITSETRYVCMGWLCDECGHFHMKKGTRKECVYIDPNG